MGRPEALRGTGLRPPQDGLSMWGSLGQGPQKDMSTLSKLSELAVKIWLSSGLHFLFSQIHNAFLMIVPQ